METRDHIENTKTINRDKSRIFYGTKEEGITYKAELNKRRTYIKH